MEVAETQLARTLAALTQQEFPLTRGLETRLDAYLQLEELLRLEDSETSVIELQRHVSSLLNEIRFDLQHNTLSDVLHAALRCLSYFLHHRSLASAVSDEHLAFFLGELVRLLFSTQDQNTYKLCLWCLTVQNFPAERHKFLPRTVEGLVQAVVNPFKSRAIEVQALKGLHLLLVKYPEQVGVDDAILSIYVKPVASRLASSEASTRTQARLVLEETSKHLKKWSKETLEMVQNCAEKYLLPVMEMHMEKGRRKDAVYLWKLTLVLLKSRFSSDLGKLNKVLFVPEKCMEDEDAAVRLMAMQAWGDVVDVFHEYQNWLFNKAIVCLLAWPVKVCLEQELLLNVVDAAFLSWRKIVSVAVLDFNEHCRAQQHAGQQNVPNWKYWFGELVMSPLVALLKKPAGSSVELEQFIDFAKQIWEPMAQEANTSKSSPSRSESSSCTTMGGSESARGKDSAARRDEELSPPGQCRITYEWIGVAFLLEVIFSGVSSLIKIFDESRSERRKKRVKDLGLAIWNGVCKRIHSHDGVTSHLGLRLVRMCIDFSFGLLGTTDASDMPAPTVIIASVGFGLEWQLQLLAPLVSGVISPGALQAVLLHPKSKLFEHITQRMEYLKDMYVPCLAVLEKWMDSKVGIDFTNKSNVIPHLVLNLLFEYAVFVDDVNNDHQDEKQSALTILDAVINSLLTSVRIQEQTRGVCAIVHFGEESIRAAHELAAYDYAKDGRKSMLDELVLVSKNMREHTAESQQNASLLLDLHNSTGTAGVIISPTLSDSSGTEEKTGQKGTGVVLESDNVVASLGTTTSSPCLLSGELATVSSTCPVDLSPASPADSKAKSADETTAATDEEADVTSAPSTPQKSGTTKQKDNMESIPVGSQSAPPKLAVGRTQRPILSTSKCIYPDLVGCTEAITSLYRHFPLGFRPFFSFYKIKTVGDLSALPVEKVRTFGLKEPVSTVRRALEEFNGRRDRMKTLTGSPFKNRSSSASSSPAVPLPFPHKPAKRRFQLESGGIAPLALETRDHKRTKRSLVLEGDDEETAGDQPKPKLAEKVTFCLQSGDTGETRITRPEEDSQDQLKLSEKVEEKESVQEKMDTFTLKLLQHLRRSAYYMDKLVAEENMQSQEASLRTSIENVGGVITNYQEAHDVVSRLASQLQIAAETSSKRCQKLLDKRG